MFTIDPFQILMQGPIFYESETVIQEPNSKIIRVLFQN